MLSQLASQMSQSIARTVSQVLSNLAASTSTCSDSSSSSASVPLPYLGPDRFSSLPAPLLVSIFHLLPPSSFHSSLRVCSRLLLLHDCPEADHLYKRHVFDAERVQEEKKREDEKSKAERTNGDDEQMTRGEAEQKGDDEWMEREEKNLTEEVKDDQDEKMKAQASSTSSSLSSPPGTWRAFLHSISLQQRLLEDDEYLRALAAASSPSLSSVTSFSSPTAAASSSSVASSSPPRPTYRYQLGTFLGAPPRMFVSTASFWASWLAENNNHYWTREQGRADSVFGETLKLNFVCWLDVGAAVWLPAPYSASASVSLPSPASADEHKMADSSSSSSSSSSSPSPSSSSVFRYRLYWRVGLNTNTTLQTPTISLSFPPEFVESGTVLTEPAEWTNEDLRALLRQKKSTFMGEEAQEERNRERRRIAMESEREAQAEVPQPAEEQEEGEEHVLAEIDAPLRRFRPPAPAGAMRQLNADPVPEDAEAQADGNVDRAEPERPAPRNQAEALLHHVAQVHVAPRPFRRPIQRRGMAPIRNDGSMRELLIGECEVRASDESRANNNRVKVVTSMKKIDGDLWHKQDLWIDCVIVERMNP